LMPGWPVDNRGAILFGPDPEEKQAILGRG